MTTLTITSKRDPEGKLRITVAAPADFKRPRIAANLLGIHEGTHGELRQLPTVGLEDGSREYRYAEK